MTRSHDIVIGELDAGGALHCDLEVLLDTRLLIQSNSGGGKSRTLRRMLEQTHRHVPQIIIDYEGDFGTLREKYDYVLAAARGGDVVAHPRTAALLAERLLELRTSAIIDIYELLPPARIAFVKLFLEAIINSRKELWHPWIIVLDEAHMFAPEKGHAESLNAVVGLTSLGRKRGFCAWLATQRIAKLHKDAAAECNNTLVGRTRLDGDRKRVGDDLGFSKERTRELMKLPPGTFFASGPAFSVDEPEKVMVGDVQTTHPKAGTRLKIRVPPPSAKVKAMLAQLADLPAEAEEHARTLDELRAEVARLKREASKKPAPPPAAPAEPKKSRREDLARIRQLSKALEAAMKIIVHVNAEGFLDKMGDVVDREALRQAIDAAVDSAAKSIEGRLNRHVRAVEQLQARTRTVAADVERLLAEDVTLTVNVAQREPFVMVPEARPRKQPREVPPGNSSVPLKRGAREMLAVLAAFRGRALSRRQLATLSGLSPQTGTYSAYLSALRTSGLISDGSDGLEITPAGLDYFGGGALPNPPTSTADLVAVFGRRLKAGARKMLDVVIEAYPEAISRAELAKAAELSAATGTFSAYLSALRGNALIDDVSDGIRASEALFIGGPTR